MKKHIIFGTMLALALSGCTITATDGECLSRCGNAKGAFPCPLCHEAPALCKQYICINYKSGNYGGGNGRAKGSNWTYAVRCANKFCLVEGTRCGFKTPEEAVADWNRRVEHNKPDNRNH